MGINDSIDAPENTAFSINNMRYDTDNKAWVGDRGLAQYWYHKDGWTFVEDGTITAEAYLNSQVDSLYFWKRGGSSDIYHFVEQGGYLYYFLGNKGQGTSYAGVWSEDVTVIQSNRHIPKTGESGTQYIPYGNGLLILNGVDEPIWFTGEDKWRNFGFTLPTPQPNAIDVQSSYPQDEPLVTGTGAPYFSSTSTFGLGDTTGKNNQYSWKMTYVMDTGSESPLSSPDSVTWKVDTTLPDPDAKFGVVLQTPNVPEGGMARRIYRTKNKLVDSDADALYYFVKEIRSPGSNCFIDIVADLNLTDLAPANTASRLVSSDYGIGENWDSRIWLAKGTEIIYSERGLPEQFGALSYFDLGNTEGGDVTGLEAFYNALYVFRENAISVIRPNGGGYTIATVSANTGTSATNAIVRVPGLGIVFVANDGIYVLSGGFDGGSVASLKKISDRVNGEWEEVNTALLQTAHAQYSSLEKEVWFMLPSNYSTVPDKGLVLHLLDGSIEWSTRQNTGISNTEDLYWFSAMTTTLDGRFVLGIKPSWTNGVNAGSQCSLFGPLHVWCAVNEWSQSAICTSVEDNLYSFTFATTEHPGSHWISSWLSMSPSMFRVYSVEIEALSAGSLLVNAEYTTDYNLKNNISPQKQADPKLVYTAKEPAVTSDTTTNSITKHPFIVNTDYLTDKRKIILRFDHATELCDTYRFGLNSAGAPFSLRSFSINTKVQNVPVINQNAKPFGQTR